MKCLSFRVQSGISLFVLACAFLLGQIFKRGIFYNIGWISVGLLFTIHPVWPEMWAWRDPDQLKKGVRIGCVLVAVIFGFFTRYGA